MLQTCIHCITAQTGNFCSNCGQSLRIPYSLIGRLCAVQLGFDGYDRIDTFDAAKTAWESDLDSIPGEKFVRYDFHAHGEQFTYLVVMTDSDVGGRAGEIEKIAQQFKSRVTKGISGSSTSFQIMVYHISAAEGDSKDGGIFKGGAYRFQRINYSGHKSSRFRYVEPALDRAIKQSRGLLSEERAVSHQLLSIMISPVIEYGRACARVILPSTVARDLETGALGLGQLASVLAASIAISSLISSLLPVHSLLPYDTPILADAFFLLVALTACLVFAFPVFIVGRMFGLRRPLLHFVVGICYAYCVFFPIYTFADALFLSGPFGLPPADVGHFARLGFPVLTGDLGAFRAFYLAFFAIIMGIFFHLTRGGARFVEIFATLYVLAVILAAWIAASEYEKARRPAPEPWRPNLPIGTSIYPRPPAGGIGPGGRRDCQGGNTSSC